jgi:hypothetical protein
MSQIVSFAMLMVGVRLLSILDLHSETAVLSAAQAQDVLADVMQRAGVCLSRQASRLFTPGLPSRITDAGAAVKGGQHPRRAATQAVDLAIAYRPALTTKAIVDDGATLGSIDTPGSHVAKDQAAQLYAVGQAGVALKCVGSLDLDEWTKLMDRNTQPAPILLSCCDLDGGADGQQRHASMPVMRVTLLRPKLAQTRTLLASASVEPPWLRSAACGGTEGRWDAAAWERVANTVGVLLTRCGAVTILNAALSAQACVA